MSKDIKIVATNVVLRYFRKINFFKVELGSTLKQASSEPGKEQKIKVLDTFVKKYENITNGKLIHKYGSIGTISFYEDSTLPRYDFHIYKGDQIFEIEITPEDMDKDSMIFLSQTLQMIDEQKTKKESDIGDGMIKNMVYTNIPDELKTPDMKLEKKPYIQALLDRRRLIDKVNTQQ